MDGAWLGAIDISQNKAYTARSFDMPTADLQPLSSRAAPLRHRGEQRRQPDLLPGRHPAPADGEVAGAIGVSGGSVEQDHEVAEAGVAAF